MSYGIKDLTFDIGTGLVDPRRLQEFDPAVIRSIKAETPNLQRSISASVRNLDESKREVEYAATVEVVDRMGDLILTRPRASLKKPIGENGETTTGEGFKTGNFHAAGAPFLWSHLAREAAIGQVRQSVQKKIDTPEDGRVWATLQRVRYLFDERIPYAVPAWILVEAGIAKSVSVGFAAELVWWPDDDGLRQKLGLKGWGVIFLTSDQTELSQAQTPANQLALATGKGFAGPNPDEVRELLDASVGREVGGRKLTPGLLKDWRRAFPSTPAEEAEVLTGRLEGFFDAEGISDELERILSSGAEATERALSEIEEDAGPETAEGAERHFEPVVLERRGIEIEVSPELAESLHAGSEMREEVERQGAAEIARQIDEDVRDPEGAEARREARREAAQDVVDEETLDYLEDAIRTIAEADLPEGVVFSIAPEYAERLGIDLEEARANGLEGDEAGPTLKDCAARGTVEDTRDLHEATLALARIARELGLNPTEVEPSDVEAAFRTFHVEHGKRSAELERLRGLDLVAEAADRAERAATGSPAPTPVGTFERQLLERCFERFSDGFEALAELYERTTEGTRGVDQLEPPATIASDLELARSLQATSENLAAVMRARNGSPPEGQVSDALAGRREHTREGGDDVVLVEDLLDR